MTNPFGRTDERQAIENLHASIGSQDKEIRMLKAALNNRDMDIRQLKAELDAAKLTITRIAHSELLDAYQAQGNEMDDIKAKLAVVEAALHRVEATGYARAVGIARGALFAINGEPK